MADLNFKINIGGTETIAKTFGEVRKAIKDAEFQALALSEQFGETDQRVIDLRKQIGQLKDTIQDSTAATKNYAGTSAIFPAIAKSVQGIASGFAAAQGAINLFGGEAKNVEKALLKVQSAMALSQGLGDLLEAKDSFVNLAGVIKGGVVNAFNTLRTAIGSTGIGLLVIGLGLLVANFEKIKKAVLDFIPGLAQVGEFFGNLVNTITDFVGITSEAERQLEKLQKTTERGNEEIKNRIKVLQSQGGKEKEIYEESQKLVENDLNVLRQTLSAKGKLTEEEQQKFRELNTEKEVLRLNETKRIGEENKKQAEDNKKKNDEILKQNEERRQKELENEQKRRDAVLDVEKQIRSIRQETERIGLSEKDRRLLEAKQELDNNLKLYQDNLDARQKAYILYDERIKSANAQTAVENEEKTKKDTEEQLKRFTERGVKSLEIAVNTSNAEFELQKKAAEDEQAILEARLNAQLQFSSALGSVFSNLSAMFEKGTTASKVAALAEIGIQSGIGLVQGLDIAQKSAKGTGPAAAFAFPIFYATQVAAVLSAVSKAKGILSTVKGGGVSSAPMPSISSSAPMTPQAPQAQITQLNAESINALGNQAIKAYVVETDVTTNQQRIKAIQQRARFD